MLNKNSREGLSGALEHCGCFMRGLKQAQRGRVLRAGWGDAWGLWACAIKGMRGGPGEILTVVMLDSGTYETDGGRAVLIGLDEVGVEIVGVLRCVTGSGTQYVGSLVGSWLGGTAGWRH